MWFILLTFNKYIRCNLIQNRSYTKSEKEAKNVSIADNSWGYVYNLLLRLLCRLAFPQGVIWCKLFLPIKFFQCHCISGWQIALDSSGHLSFQSLRWLSRNLKILHQVLSHLPCILSFWFQLDIILFLIIINFSLFGIWFLTLFIQITKYVIEKSLNYTNHVFAINVGFAKSLLSIGHNFLVGSIHWVFA